MKDPKPESELDIETLLITSGRSESEPSLPPVLYPATVFENPSLEEAHRMSLDPDATLLYTRYGNPTIAAFESAMAELEGAERARAFASGMGAISTVILGLCESGDHIVAQSQLYAGTVSLLNFIAERFKIQVSFVDGLLPGAFQEAVIKGKTKLIFAESPANPQLGIVDLEELGAISGPITVVDATLAPPVIQTPIKYGVDIVLHSATKAIGGHNDATLGVISGSDELLRWIWSPAVLLGANAAPQEALKGLKGIRTLGVRQERQCKTALALAQMLESHKAVKSVSYPGLKSHPQYGLAQKQMKLGGSMVCFDIACSDTAEQESLNELLKQQVGGFFKDIKLARLASSLGGPETLVTHPASTTHVDLNQEEMEAAGISQGTIRVSVGLENTEDIVADFQTTLDHIQPQIQAQIVPNKPA